MAATRSLSTTTGKKKQPLPFYEAPEKAPAKIITEARRSVRAISTERPFTPAYHRNLFGGGESQSRPPSAFSIGARHFTEESRPGTAQRLPPIEKTVAEGSTSKKLRRVVKPTPPTPVQSFEDLSILTTSPPPPPAPVHRATSQPLAQSTSLPQQTADSDALTPPLHLTTSPSEASRTSALPLGTVLSPSTSAGSRGRHVSISGGASEVKGELASGNSGELELKQSQFSPVHSKRSLSADTVKRFLLSQLESNGVEIGARVISAGNERKEHSKKRSSQVMEGKKRKGLQGEAGGRPPETRKSSADLPFWKPEIVPLLHDLESTPYQQVEYLCTTSSSLWECLKRRGLLGKTGGVGGTKRRSAVLKTIFKLLDHKDPRLLLKVAKIIVAMQVVGKNLLNVCKLLFRLGKEEANDQLFEAEFLTGYLIDALLSANPLKEPETMVYGLGVVKLLASSPALRDQMVDTEVMALISSTLTVCCETCLGSQPTALEMTHMRNILIQLTGALRSLCDAISMREAFVTSNIIPQLAAVLGDHITDADIVFNISRFLSKLTLDSNCLSAVLLCPPLLPHFLQVLSLHSHHMDIILRVCFILGNMTADDDSARHALFFQHSSLVHLNPLFKEYLQLEMEKTLGNQSEESAAPGSESAVSKSQDVLIKLVRLVANLSVHPEVGPRIAGDEDTVDCLMMTLANLPLLDYQELILNTLATLNNISYYAQTESYIIQRQKEVAELMVSVMMVDSTELLLESTRVCGNLSRHPDVRDVLVDSKVDEIMVTLLDSGRREMVYSACGVLINILADSTYHQNIASCGGVQKLVEVLHDFGRGDWQLASLVCKTLWNLSEMLTSSLSCFGEGLSIQLIGLLENYSNESFALSPPESPHLQLTAASWQSDFLPVAQALLARMKAHSSNLDLKLS